MTIKNLSQFKKAINAKTPFVIVDHFVHPQYIGQTRVPHIVQTNGMYSGVLMPDGTLNTSWNYGKGLWYGYEKAGCYKFDGDLVKVFKPRRHYDEAEWTLDPVMTIKFIG